MILPYRYRPSPGFLFLVICAVGAILFLAWGFSTPDLDRAWWGITRIEAGEASELTPEEADALGRLRERYPELAATVGPDGRVIERLGAEDAPADGDGDGE